MPEVYDPNGGNMFRSRRGRKRKVAKAAAVSSSAKSNASPSQNRLSRRQLPTQRLREVTSPKDPLEFGGHSDGEASVDNVVASRKAPPKYRKTTQRKLKIASLSNDEAATKATVMKPRSKKRRKNDVLSRVSWASSSSPLESNRGKTQSTTGSEASVTNGRTKHDIPVSMNHSSRYAIAVDTRCLDTRAGKDDQEDFSSRVKDFLQTIFRKRGFSPSCVTLTECCNSNTLSKKKNKNPRKIPLGESLGESSHALLTSNNEHDATITILSQPILNNNLNEMLSKVKGSPIQSLKSGDDDDDDDDDNMEAHLPDGLLAKSTWSVFGDLGTYNNLEFSILIFFN